MEIAKNIINSCNKFVDTPPMIIIIKISDSKEKIFLLASTESA